MVEGAGVNVSLDLLHCTALSLSRYATAPSQSNIIKLRKNQVQNKGLGSFFAKKQINFQKKLDK